MTDSEKVLTYEDAKRLCRVAFDGGVDYGEACVRYSCNAVAYDWEHWLAKNERLFRPAPTVEGVLRELEDMRGNGATYGDVIRRCSDLAATLRKLLEVDA